MPTCRSEELAIKPPIFRLVDDLFYLLSHSHPLSHPVSPSWQIRWVLSKLPVFSINFPPLCCCSYSAARQETFTETQKCYLRRILSSYDKFRLLKLSRFPFVLFHRCPYLYFLVLVFYLFLSFCLEYFFSTSRNLSAAACVKLHMEFVLSGCESVWGKTESGQSLFSLSAFPPYSPYTLSLCLYEESIALNDAGITHLPAFLADQLLVCPLHHFYFTML